MKAATDRTPDSLDALVMLWIVVVGMAICFRGENAKLIARLEELELTQMEAAQRPSPKPVQPPMPSIASGHEVSLDE